MGARGEKPKPPAAIATAGSEDVIMFRRVEELVREAARTTQETRKLIEQSKQLIAEMKSRV